MELNGALLNRDIQENMALSADLAGHLGKLPNAEPRKRPALARRSGLVRSAVFPVLAVSEHPLCLHKNSRRPDSPIERVSHGRYRHL